MKNINKITIISYLISIITILIAIFFYFEAKEAKINTDNIRKEYQQKNDELSKKVKNLEEEIKKLKTQSINYDSDSNEDSKTKTPSPKPIGKDYEYSTSEIRKLSEDENYGGKKIAFLTFDDGPNHDITPHILDVLKEKQVHGTFFMVGNAVSKETKDVIERVISEGHSIGAHSFTHDYDYLYPDGVPNPERVLKEYNEFMKALKSSIGKDIKVNAWRYPGGHLSWDSDGIKLADEALKNVGVEWIDWNMMNGDAQIETSDNPNEILRPKNVQEAINNVEKSKIFTSNPDIAVILMHDASGKEITLKALPGIIDSLKSQGYEFGTLK